MKKTTSIFAILLVAMSFLAMSFTKTPALLGASSMVASTMESTDARENELQPVPVVCRPGIVVTYTVKCGISLYMISQAPMISFVVDGTIEHLSAGLNNEKTPARLMHSL